MGGFGAAGANTGFGADNGGGFGPAVPVAAVAVAAAAAAVEAEAAEAVVAAAAAAVVAVEAAVDAAARAADPAPSMASSPPSATGGATVPPITVRSTSRSQNSALNAAPFSLNGETHRQAVVAPRKFRRQHRRPAAHPQAGRLGTRQHVSSITPAAAPAARSDSVSTVPTAGGTRRRFFRCHRRLEPGGNLRSRSPHNPFPGNIIPTTRLNPASVALLQYFPLPMYSGSDPELFHRALDAERQQLHLAAHRDAAAHQQGQHQLQRSISAATIPPASSSSGSRTPPAATALSATAGWSHSFKPRFNNNATLAFSRNISKTARPTSPTRPTSKPSSASPAPTDAPRLRPAQSFLHQLRQPLRWHRLPESQPDHQFHRHHHLRRPAQAQSHLRLRLPAHAEECALLRQFARIVQLQRPAHQRLRRQRPAARQHRLRFRRFPARLSRNQLAAHRQLEQLLPRLGHNGYAQDDYRVAAASP